LLSRLRDTRIQITMMTGMSRYLHCFFLFFFIYSFDCHTHPCAIMNHSLLSIFSILCLYYWNEHLNILKQQCCDFHKLWRLKNSPRSGCNNDARLAAKRKYKLAIKEYLTNYDNKLSSDLNKYLVNKNPKQFW